jgi:hypothetical protein
MSRGLGKLLLKRSENKAEVAKATHDWLFLNCTTCAQASTAHWYSKRPEHEFKLCESCSKEIETLKGGTYVQTNSDVEFD